MKKTFRSVLCLSAMALAFGSISLLSSCKDKQESQVKTISTESEEDEDESFDGLHNILTKACNGYSCDDEDCSDEDEFELIDVDTVIDDEDGTEIPVAYFKCGGEIFQLMDIDGDGTFDVAVCDGNGDDDISDDEIVDISSEEITIDDIAEMAGIEDDCDEECEVSYDDDDSEGVSSSDNSRRRLQRQAEEDAYEQDLPDYVNNAHVKALRKR